MFLPDKFVPVQGARVKVTVYDICPLREDYSVTPIVLSILRDLARGTEVLVDHSDDIISETTLSEKRVEDALRMTDADLLVFGSYVATRSNMQPMIHLVCTYGRPMEAGGGLPQGMDLNQAVEEGDAILQMPRHVLIRDVLPVGVLETLSFQNGLAEEIFNIAQFIQAVKLYKAGKFEETTQVVGNILNRLGTEEQWPSYWAPFNYLNMLSGLAYLRMGNGQAAAYTLSNAMARSTPAKMRIQRCAEQIFASLIQPQAPEPEESGEADQAPEQPKKE